MKSVSKLSGKTFLQRIAPRLALFLVLAATAKGVGTLLQFFLPGSSLYMIPLEGGGFYPGSVTLSKALELQEKKPEPVKAEQKEKPLYRLDNLKLKAVYAEEGRGFIVVEDKGKSEFIGLNEEFNGYKLVEIHPKKGVLTRDGNRYELSMEEEKVPLYREKKAEKKAELPAGETVQAMKSVPRSEIAKYRKDMSMIWSNIGLKEYKANGVLDGFVVTFVKKGSVFEQLGLQKDDVLKAANGTPLKSFRDALKVYKSIDKISSLKLTIMRNNEEKELEYDIN